MLCTVCLFRKHAGCNDMNILYYVMNCGQQYPVLVAFGCGILDAALSFIMTHSHSMIM